MTTYFWFAQMLNFIGCVLSAASLWLVLWLSPRRWINQSYVLFSLAMFLWQAGNWMTRLSINIPSLSANSMLWLHVSVIGFGWLNITLFWFIESLYPLPRRWRVVVYGLGIMIHVVYTIMTLADQIVVNPYQLPTGGFSYTIQPVAFILSAFLYLFSFLTIGILIRQRAWRRYWAATAGVIFIQLSIFSSIFTPTRSLNIIMFALIAISFLTYEVLRQQLFNPLVTMNQRLESEVALRTHELQQTLAEQERVRSELAVAKSIQQRLLPDYMPNMQGMHLAASSMPALEVGGDYFTFHQLNQHTIVVAIGDVSGKGVPAALLMALTLRTFEMLVEHYPDQGRLLVEIDRALSARLSQYKMNTALLTMMLDRQKQRLWIANAGAIPPFLWRNGTVTLIESYGLPIGTELKHTYQQTDLHLQSGDRLLLVSDGIVEAMNPDGELWGFERLEMFLQEHGDASAQLLTEQVMLATDTWIGSATPNDDRTIVVLSIDH